jgi:hypothetical protein
MQVTNRWDLLPELLELEGVVTNLLLLLECLEVISGKASLTAATAAVHLHSNFNKCKQQLSAQQPLQMCKLSNSSSRARLHSYRQRLPALLRNHKPCKCSSSSSDMHTGEPWSSLLSCSLLSNRHHNSSSSRVSCHKSNIPAQQPS